MLQLLVKGVDDAPEGMDLDVERVFAGVSLTGSESEKQVIEFIEEGKYLDNLSFIDRFGYRLSRELLSSGTKAVLSVLHFPTIPVNCEEVGYNAFSALVRFCHNGIAYVNNFPYPLITEGISEIDVMYRGMRFQNPQNFAEYLKSGWPYAPDEEDV